MAQVSPSRRLFDERGRFIPRRYNDGRGMLACNLGFAVEPDFRAYVRQAAAAAGTTVADLGRRAIEARAAEILSRPREAA